MITIWDKNIPLNLHLFKIKSINQVLFNIFTRGMHFGKIVHQIRNKLWRVVTFSKSHVFFLFSFYLSEEGGVHRYSSSFSSTTLLSLRQLIGRWWCSCFVCACLCQLAGECMFFVDGTCVTTLCTLIWKKWLRPVVFTVKNNQTTRIAQGNFIN